MHFILMVTLITLQMQFSEVSFVLIEVFGIKKKFCKRSRRSMKFVWIILNYSHVGVMCPVRGSLNNERQFAPSNHIQRTVRLDFSCHILNFLYLLLSDAVIERDFNSNFQIGQFYFKPMKNLPCDRHERSSSLHNWRIHLRKKTVSDFDELTDLTAVIKKKTKHNHILKWVLYHGFTLLAVTDAANAATKRRLAAAVVAAAVMLRQSIYSLLSCHLITANKLTIRSCLRTTYTQRILVFAVSDAT